MIIAFRVLRSKIGEIPSVVHVDDTARIQSVSKKTNPRYWNLIDKFRIKTGVPVLLNTSFNVKGQPIVNTPLQAIECFQGTNIDFLAVGDYWAEKA